jgi:hypothetical protein
MLLELALAAADTTDVTESETSVFELAPIAVTIVLGTLVPFVTGLVTKYLASEKLKAVVNLTLAAIVGVLTASTVVDGSAILSEDTLILAGLAWVQSVASYLGLWKTLNINAHLAPAVGLGAPVQNGEGLPA